MLKKKKHHVEEEEDFRERARRGTKEKAEKGRYKMVEDDNTFRILKTPKGETSPMVFMYWKIHRHVGPNDGWGRCGLDADGEGYCWLENKKIPELRKKGKMKAAAKLESEDQFSVQVAAIEDGEWRGPLLWTRPVGGPKSMNYRLEQIIQSVKRDAVDPKKGYNVTINRTGTGMNDTNYGPTMYDDEPTAVPKEIMARLKPFDQVLPEYDEDRLKAAYYGRDVEEKEEEEEERPRKKGKPRDEEEEPEETEEEEQEEETEEESEEESEEVEEEEEEPPAKKKSRSKDEEEEESEEEEEEESEEEEEEEPKKPAKKSKRSEPEDEEEYEEVETEEESSDEEEEEEEPEEEEEEEEPAPKKKVKKPIKKK